MSNLNELQRDVLGETINLATGQAAVHLSEMTGDEVMMTVPEVDLVAHTDPTHLGANALAPQINNQQFR